MSKKYHKNQKIKQKQQSGGQKTQKHIFSSVSDIYSSKSVAKLLLEKNLTIDFVGVGFGRIIFEK